MAKNNNLGILYFFNDLFCLDYGKDIFGRGGHDLREPMSGMVRRR